MFPSLKPFAFEDDLVRTIVDDKGEPWFVAKDVCAILELGNITEALRPLDDDERGSVTLNTLGGNQDMLTVSESGLYSLIFRSRKPEAKRFKKWVTSEVLPSIRKTGAYLVPGLTAEKKAAIERLPEATKRSALNTGIKELANLAQVYEHLAPQFKDDIVELCLLFSPSEAPQGGKALPSTPVQHSLLGGAS